jgi:hypothetical protein
LDDGRVTGQPGAVLTEAARNGYGRGGQMTGAMENRATRQAETLGWSDCRCPDVHDFTPDLSKYRRGHVLDPFAGSGTTLAAAIDCGRDATGIDLDARNLELARERVGLFLEEAAV